MTDKTERFTLSSTCLRFQRISEAEPRSLPEKCYRLQASRPTLKLHLTSSPNLSLLPCAFLHCTSQIFRFSTSLLRRRSGPLSHSGNFHCIRAEAVIQVKSRPCRAILGKHWGSLACCLSDFLRPNHVLASTLDNRFSDNLFEISESSSATWSTILRNNRQPHRPTWRMIAEVRAPLDPEHFRKTPHCHTLTGPPP